VDLEPGVEVTTLPCSLFTDRVPEEDHYLLTFDGGAREVDLEEVSSAAAILWGPRNEAGDRHRLRTASVQLPGIRNSQVAEAWGLRLACLLLLMEGGQASGLRSATIAGDNLAVIRYGAAQGRLHRPEMQGLLEQVLARLALSGWELNWLAMRRCFNTAADALATEALTGATALAKLGLRLPVVFGV